ncbi:hypothetical protein H8M03_09215 [Sphingomonas sabuli]|uniref:Lipoprotein n=1 Tax=Sphingomonas sabuli TaxID=2764186 RepID=A0A7G9L0Q0_9SPHN|nr:hypothetical protein [Sphingomonas sabuli]QNM82199.1 hypothetical protein H8M03_09215 [Sphingomonas sabuli]
MTRIFLAAAATVSLTACAAVPPPTVPPPPPCAVAGSSDWNAWINKMPGPGARPTLHVTGKVTTPTGGYTVGFDQPLQVRESFPVQVVVTLQAAPPAGAATQAIVTHDVRGQWPMDAAVGSVEVRCGTQTLATIAPVPEAN